MRYVGIDPGLTGAIAVLDMGEHGLIRWALYDMPLVTLVPTGRIGPERHEIDVDALVEIFMRETGRCANVAIVIEKVCAAPIQGRRQGTVSMFRFGESFGIIKGILSGLQLPYSLVSPQTWKKAILSGMPKGKESSLVIGREIYPECAKELTRAKDHGRAEALLLAHYARTCPCLSPSGSETKLAYRVGIPLPF